MIQLHGRGLEAYQPPQDSGEPSERAEDGPPRLYDIIAELASDVSIDDEVHEAHIEQLLDLEYALSMQQYMTASTLASVL